MRKGKKLAASLARRRDAYHTMSDRGHKRPGSQNAKKGCSVKTSRRN